MKLLSVTSARVVWLFDVFRLNPTGLSNKLILDGLKERYQFAKSPSHMLDIDASEKGLIFDQGRFVAHDKRDLYVALNVYSDGIVAKTASSTNETLEFLEDLKEFIQSLGFSFPAQELIAEGYTSVLVVECETPIIGINPKLSEFVQLIHARLKTLDGKPRDYEVTGVAFWPEDVGKPFAPAGFKFERKIGQPFGSNMYYTEAPLTTSEHLVMLEELERLMKG